MQLYQDTPDFVDGPDGLPGLVKDVADSNAQPVPYFNRENQMLCSLNGGELAAGTYTYTLTVDGVLVDARQMVLTR